MTDFSLMAPGSQEPNPPQIDYAARDRELSARALAGALEFSPEEREQNLMRSFNAAREMNPQVTRMAKRNAEAAGIPFETALQDPKFAEQVLRQQEMERRDLWNRNPTVARFMEDVEFAKLASDDVESLVRTDGFLNTYWAGRQIASGWQQQEQGDLWMNILNKGGEPTLSQSLRLEELDGILRRQKEEEGWTGGFFNVLGQVGGTAGYAVPAAFAGAKAGAVLGPKGAVIGGALAARAVVFSRALNTERGNKYGELRKMGLSHEDAEKGSLGYGLVSAGLETIGWGFLTAPAKNLIMDRAARLVSEGLTQELMKSAGKRFIKDTAYGFVPELGTELMQTAAGYFTDLWTIQGSSLNAREKLETAEGIQDLSTQLADTLLQTVKSIGPLSTIAPAIRLSQESRLAREASRSSQLLTDIVQTAGESKLAEEAPQEFARVLNEQAKKAGVETIYIDPEAFEEVIAAADQADIEARAKDAGVTVEEMQQRVGETGTGTRAMLQEKMPEVMNRLDQVKDAGEQVEINTAKFVEVFKNTRLLLLLQKHIKFQRNGRTAAQAEQFEQAKAQLKAQADKAVSESAQKREQLMQGANELRDELRDSLKDVAVQKVEGEVATPMAKEETSTVIEWVVNAAIVGASEDNVSVGEWWAANKFTVLKDVSPEQARQEQSLQAAGRRAVPTDPRLQEAAKALAAGTITRTQYDAAVAEFKPVRPFTEPVAPAGMDQVTGAVNATAKPKVSAPETVQDGREVSIRLDIPALAKGVGVVTVHEKSSGFKAGSPIAYTPAARLVNAVMGFVGGKAFKIAQGEGKDTIGIIKGTYKADTVENIQKAAQEAFTDPAWKQVGGDPERHAYFYDRETMQPVVSADEVIQIGNMVLAKNPVYGDPADFLYAEGRAGGGVQGSYFPRTRTIALYEAATLTTFLHEASHWWMTTLFARARQEGASQTVKDKLGAALRALGVDSLETWDALSNAEQEAKHEAFAYNFEDYLLQGRAPTEEQRGLFATIARWTRRLYSNLRTTLSETYEREFGQPLPMLSPELRQVFDRMTATEEQIEATELLRDLMPMFQTKEEALESGMSPEEWEQFEKNTEAAREAALERLSTASIDQMKNLAGAINDTLASKQRSMEKERREIRSEVEKKLKVEKIYRIIRWLQTKVALDENGVAFNPTIPNKIAVSDIVRLVQSGALPDLKEPAAPKESVVKDKATLAEQQQRANEMRAQVQKDEQRLEILRKEFKDLPRTPLEGLDQSGLIYQSRKELDEQRAVIQQAEKDLAAKQEALAKAEAEYEKNRKKSKKVRMAEGLTEAQWEAEQNELDAQLPKEVAKVNMLESMVQKAREDLDSRGTKKVPQLKQAVQELVGQLTAAENDLKAAQEDYATQTRDARDVEASKKEALIAELAATMERVKAAETKVAQKRSNLAKARVDLEDAQKRPTVEGTDRDKLQSNLRNLMSQRKTAEEKLRDGRAKLRRQAEAAAETALDRAKKDAKKAQAALDKQQENLEKITKKMTMTRRQEAAVEVRRIHRFVQSERVRLRELEKRIETLEKKIELNEPTLQGPVIERLGNMLTRQESGVSLQAVAALWSIQGGSTELLRMLYQTPALEEAIEAETDRLMMEKHGDYQSREAAEGVVADAMHEQARTKLVATELRWLQQQVQRIAEDLDPDLKKQREDMATELELANKRVEDLSATIQQVKETAKLNPKLAELEKQRASAQEQVQEASAAVAAGGPNAGAAAADLQQKQAALTQVLGEIDAIYGPDYTSALTEWNAAKKQARELELRNRKPQLSVDVMVAAAAAVAEDAIDNTMVKEISSAKHQAEEGRQNRKTLEALGMTRAKDKKGQPRLFKALEAKRLQLVHHMKAKAARRAEKEIKKIELAMKRVFKSPLENVNKNYNTELYTAARALAAIFGFGPEVAVARAAEQLQATSKYHPEMWQRIQDILGPSILQSQQVKDYRELTFSQLKDVNQLVKGLLELARAEKVVELNGRRVEVEEAQNKLTESLSKHKKPFAGMGSQKAASNWQKFLKFWDGTKAWLRGMEQWTVSIDGGRGAWWDLVYNPIKTSLSAYSVERNRLVAKYAELLSNLDIDQDPVSGSEIGYEFKSMAEVLGALMHVGNRSNYRKLLLGRGWGAEVNNELDDSRWKAFVQRLHDEGKLKKEHWDFLQNVWDMMEGIKPRLQESHFKVFGYYFREVQYEPIETPFGSYRGGYVPAKTDPMLVASRQSEEDINQINGDMRAAVPSVHSNWRHERVEAYTQPLNLDLTMVLRHIDETVRFIHVQPVVQNVLRVIRPFGERNSPLGQVDQAAYSELIIPWMVSAARQVTSTRGSAFGHQVIDRLRRWTGLDALFGNLANALGNLTSLPMAVRKIGWRAVGSGLRQVLSSGYTTRTGAERLSTWIPLQSNFMDNRQRGKMLELAQILDSLVNDPGAYRKVKNLAQKNGYFLQTMTQSFADLAIWKGAYDKFKTMPEAQGLSEQEIHNKAVEFADYIVRDSSPSLSPEDQAQYLKQGPFIRLMVQYSGYFNWLANVNVTDFGNLIRELGWKTPLSMRFYQQLILGYVAPLFLADALMSAVAGRFYDDDEDEDLASAIGENVLASVGRGTASMFPGVGQVAMALYGLSTEDPNDERVTNAPAIGYIMRAGRGAIAVAREAGELVGVTSIEKEVTGREVRDIFGLLSLLTGGLPTGFLGKPAQFLTDVNAGNYEEPSAHVWSRGLMSGKVESASR